MRRTHTLIIALVVGALALAALLPTGGAQAQTGEPAAVFKSFLPMLTGPTGTLSEEESPVAREVLALVNSARAANGCDPVTLDPKLTAAGQAHSEDMALNDYFSHTGADGSSASQRVTRAGYDWSRTGENIAAGYTSAAEVMEGWMDSPGHRANILSCAYTQMGLGYYDEAGDSFPGPYGYRHYWTQVFATP